MIIAWKDLYTEFRTKQMLNSMLIFALIVIVIFNFAFSELLTTAETEFDDTDILMDYLAAGILWIAFIFTGMLGLSRSFVAEKDKNNLEGLMLCPTSRVSIYLGKLISNLVLIFLIEIATIIFFALFFNYDLSQKVLLLMPVLILGTVGFVIVGALLSAISMNTRNREVLLPVLLFPILIPIIISAVLSTGRILAGSDFADVRNFIQILIAFDVIYMVVALVTFEYIIEE